ncbi:hypothetical protein GCM10012275_41900 [Longimycelium tulufanense]|uniref:Uncharacterized protein n=1 Tax=Longimycelium tulufanense TaxID=907463 RepID=A0A8J3CAV1_9PSEU|nr:hypothetical protein [Longimycelium tulufanense]GGM67026.1 hypothetical protein GCM10012275_41900 [Longimycelium tulufanense]
MAAPAALRHLQMIAYSFVFAAVVITVLGLFVIFPGVGLEYQAAALLPLVLAAADWLLVTLLERQAPPADVASRNGAAHFLHTMALSRMAFAEAPILVGFVLVFVLGDTALPVVSGLLGSLALLAWWWPGERLIQDARARLEPAGGAAALDEVLGR